MLQTSVDLWYVSLSVGLLCLVGFCCFVLYRLGNLIFGLNGTIGEVNKKLEMTEETINLANDTLRMLNESLRNILQLTDNLVSMIAEASGEVKKIVSMVSGMGNIMSGIVASLNLLKKK